MTGAAGAGPSAVDARRTARSTVFAVAATGLDKVGGLLVLLLIARLLGTEDFGRYAALMSLLAFFQVVAEFGQEPVLVRLLAQDPGRGRAPLVEGALAWRLLLGGAAGVLLLVVGPLVLPALGRAALALAALGLVAASGLALRALFRTAQRLEWLCVTAVVRVAVFATVLVAGHRLGLGLLAAVAGWAAGLLAASLAAAALAARTIVPRPRWHAPVARRLAGSGWALALNALLLTVTLRVGHLVVLHLEGPTAVGYLAAGSQLAEAFALLPEAVMLALLPVLSAFDVESRAAQRRVSVAAFRYFALLALGVIIVISLAAPDLLALLYGPAYVAGAPALQILAWLALLAASGIVFTNLLIARGYERLLLALNALGSGVTLVLTPLAVVRAGFVGAAAVALGASLVPQAALLLLPATRLEARACARVVVGPAATAAALIAVGLALPGPRPLLAAGGVLAFALVLVAVGSVGRRDVEVLRRLVARSGGATIDAAPR